MINKLKATAIAFALMLGTVMGFGFSEGQALASDSDNILAPVLAYQKGMYVYDVDVMMNQFTADAVVLSPNRKPFVGIKTITAAYKSVIDLFQFNVDHEVKEVVSVSDEWAYVQTHGSGELIIRPSGDIVPQEVSEVFFLRKVGKEWKIARYIFNTTLPQPKK